MPSQYTEVPESKAKHFKRFWLLAIRQKYNSISFEKSKCFTSDVYLLGKKKH